MIRFPGPIPGRWLALLSTLLLTISPSIRMQRRALSTVLLLLAILCPGPLQAQRARWVATGNADGSGSTDLEPLRHEPVKRWSQLLNGVLKSEPVVWKGSALLCLRGRAGRRTLAWIDLATGRRLAHQALPASVPLTPSVWGDRIAVRPEPGRVDLMRINGARFQVMRSIRSEEPVSEPLLVEGALFLREGGDLRAYLLDRNQPVWEVAGGNPFRGRPSYSEGVIFALRYDDRGRAALLLIDARNGEVLELIGCGDHGGRVPLADAELTIAVFAGEVFIHYPLPVPGSGGQSFNTAHVPLIRTAAGPRLAPGAGARLFSMAQAPTETPQGWMALEEVEGAPTRWIARGGQADTGLGSLLSDGDNHAGLLQAKARGAVGGNVAILGDVAADTSTWEILWRLPSVPQIRSVPCEFGPGEGGWLVATAPNQLTLYRSPAPSPDAAEKHAREKVRKLEQREADALATLAQRALRSGDTVLVSRLIRAATDRGVLAGSPASRALALAQDGLARLFAADNPRVQAQFVTAFEAEEAKLYGQLSDELAREAKASSDPALRRALLRALLERDPNHAGAALAARAMLPQDAPLGASFDAASWLAFLDTTATHPVRFEAPVARPGDDPVSQLLAKEAKEWRPDLVAYRSDRLAVITPPGHPGTAARALALGELVCGILEEWFGEQGPGKESSQGEPMVLLLYESAGEYRMQSERDNSAPEVAQGWSAGHFDPRDNLSRMFLQEGDAHGQSALSTYVHELTHHWLATRSPFAGEMRRASGERERAGFWLLEGIANLVGELQLDPVNGTWSEDNPRADSLDALTNSASSDLIPWAQFLSLSKGGFSELSTERAHRIPLTWQLGASSHRSDINMFYAQAGGLAHYLFAAENGRHRKVLLDAVTAFYRGAKPVDIAARARASADKLGTAVVEHARRTTLRN